MSRIVFGPSLHPLQTLMLVSSETLVRLRKRTCSPEPTLITPVLTTSSLFMKYSGTSSYGHRAS